MRELLEKYIGRNCIVTGSAGSKKGEILSVNDGSLELKLHKKVNMIDVINIDHIYNVTILE